MPDDVLAAGGFERDASMLIQVLGGTPVRNAAGGSNSGDGIRTAQHLHAALWHMWHIHGSHRFHHGDPSYPYAIRHERFADWFPAGAGRVKLKMPWTLADRNGNRFMSEHQPPTQDTAVRPMQHYDRDQRVMVGDEERRRMYPRGEPTSNDESVRCAWSQDNKEEVEVGILKRSDSFCGLGHKLGIDVALARSVTRWNMMCDRGADEDFRRPAGAMMRIKPLFCGAPLWATVSNTQGGPMHDAERRSIDVLGEPIPRHCAAGERGSSFGHLDLSGRNIDEYSVSGPIAGCCGSETLAMSRPRGGNLP